MTARRLRVGILATHPIQYYAPWYRELAHEVDLRVYFSYRQTAAGHAASGFGVEFEWDVPLLDGYDSTFLRNTAKRPNVNTFWGCRTPDIAAVIREQRFDGFIVHGWGTRSYWQAITACWRQGTPVLVRGDSVLSVPRSRSRRAIKYPVYRFFIPQFDGYLVVGTRARQYLLHYGARPDRCFDAPHAVDNAFFGTGARALHRDRERIRREFGLPWGAVTFLFAGRFISQKSPDTFVRAVAAAAATAPNIVGLMVGDGVLRQDTEALARRLGAPIVFAGFLNQSAMVRAYAAADVLVMPSTWETWGLVVNEAMACGLPAIVSDGVACADDLVLPGETGEVFPVGQTGELADRISRLARDAAYRDRLANGARARINSFSAAAAAAGTVEAIRVLVRRGQDRSGPAPQQSASMLRAGE